jgi:uncharacterized membrane protein YphA (DoxX/SURF4 family)
MDFRRFPRFRTVAIVLARFGLGSTYLSGVADRFGLWGRRGTPNVSWGDFQHYVARIQTLIPPASPVGALILAWVATVLEAAFGLAILIGVRTRSMAFGSAALLLSYAVVLAFSPAGLHAAFAYALLSGAGASMLLAAVGDDG